MRHRSLTAPPPSIAGEGPVGTDRGADDGVGARGRLGDAGDGLGSGHGAVVEVVADHPGPHRRVVPRGWGRTPGRGEGEGGGQTGGDGTTNGQTQKEETRRGEKK